MNAVAQALDVEGRVAPMLDELAADATFKLGCKAAAARSETDRMKACCKKYDASDPKTLTFLTSNACHVGQDKKKAKITNVETYCKDKYELETSVEYLQCAKVDMKTAGQVLDAKHNWKATMDRNYNLLKLIEDANI